MRTILTAGIVGLCLLSGTIMVSAQTTPAPSNAPAASTDGSGTGPHDTGSTGWTGGNRNTEKSPATAPLSDSPDKQPPVATGSDLKGQPKAFPSNKAPE
jgi:hypothetical protein